MTAVHDRTPFLLSEPRTHRAYASVCGPSALLAAAGVTAVFAVVVGVVIAYLVFPDPTMWRVAVNGLVIAPAFAPIRGMLRRAFAQADRQPVVDAESEI